jgi:DNA polymerase III epsilon subunit-like protein
MNKTDWILIDTETTGLTAPIFVVELAAQRMRGWEPNGIPFRRLLNQNADIPPEASRVHGYTREILERDGAPAFEVYREFSKYVGTHPIVSYNVDYDLEDVLKPEWRRLGIDPIGTAGFCALRLAQRLLDPVPAGNCKLQTLRQFYRLPDRGAHTALGDVETVSDLMANVLRPIAERRSLKTWSNVCAYTRAEWYPSRIPFGKFKGRDFRDARTDESLRDWLQWLARSTNQRSAGMGKWYLDQLAQPEFGFEDFSSISSELQEDATLFEAVQKTDGALVSYFDAQIERLRHLIAAARVRLAEVESDYTRDRSAISVTQAALFNLVREFYQKRDRLRLLVNYRRKFLKVLLAAGEQEAEDITDEYVRAKAHSDADYKQAEGTASDKHELSGEEEAELKALWRKLVSLYHPDRFASKRDSADTYEKLIKVINRAREDGNLNLLREIANDPASFILKQGWTALDFSEEKELKALQKLFESLQAEIITKLEALNTLRESADYELHRLSSRQPGLLESAAADLVLATSVEIAQLEAEAAQLKQEIDELADNADSLMVA